MQFMYVNKKYTHKFEAIYAFKWPVTGALWTFYIQITPEYKLSIPKLPNPAGGEKEKKELIKKSGYRNQQTLENEKQLSQHTLCLPVCRISESVQQLMDLAIHTLSEAVGSSPQWYVDGSTACKCVTNYGN